MGAVAAERRLAGWGGGQDEPLQVEEFGIGYAVVVSRGLLLFWSSWLSVVFASNLADGLRQAGVLPASWRFASGNLSLIQETVGIYALSRSWAPFLFGAVVVVQLAGSLLFWRAFLDREAASTRGHPKVLQAFCVAAGLFAGFLIADEVFVVYTHFPTLETTHLLVFCALLLSLTVIWLLADVGKRT